MSSGPCWARRGAARAGDVRPATSSAPSPELRADDPQSESCDLCGSADTWWRNCKLLCRGCGTIVKSCADL